MIFLTLRRRWIPYIVLASSLLLAGLATYFAAVTARAKDELRFQTWVSEIEHSIVSRLETYVGLLRGGKGLFAATNSVTRQQFKGYVNQLELERRYPGIQGVGFTLRLRPAETDSLVQRMRQEGVTDFQIKPAERRSEYHSIIYLEPLDRRNQAAIGYDMFTEPVRRAAMEQACDTGLPAASGKVTLVQEIDEQKQAGFLIYVPVYRGGTAPSTEAERRAALVGFVYSPFRSGDLLRGILGAQTEPRVDFQIYDGEKIAAEHLLYEFNPTRDPLYQPRLRTTNVIEVAGRPWKLVFSSTPVFEHYSARQQVPLIFCGSAVIGLALFLVVRSQVKASERAERVAKDLLEFEGALGESEDRYRTITETASDAIIMIDERSTIVSINRATEKIFGYTPEELLGESLTRLMPEHLRSVHKTGLACYLATKQKHLSWEGLELIGLHKNGQEVPLEVSFGEFVRGGKHYFTGVIRDVTERRQIEGSLRQSEQLFRTLTTHAPVGIFLTNAQGDCRFVNERWCEFAGLSPEQASGQGWVQALHPEDKERVAHEWYTAAQAGREFNLDYRFCTPQGKETWLHGSAIALRNEAGEFTGFLSTVADLTERKRVEAERERFLQSEQTARARAEEASRLKDEFLATVSHELRTPLNAIFGWVRMLRSRKMDAALTARALETIEKNARAQSALIDDILDVSRMITGRLRLEIQPVDPVPVIEGAIESVRPAAEAKEIQIQSSLVTPARYISGDPQRLQQVVWNLLSNAVKFTSRGGHVQVRLEDNNAHVEIVVSDNGQGINPEFLPFVFDRFRQADSSSTRTHGGLGLGLAIVRHLVELHGGSVSAESAGVGAGAIFTVKLPVLGAPIQAANEGHEALQSGAWSAPELASPPVLSGARVLVVDDQPDTLLLLQTVLKQCGAEVRSAQSAAQGFAAATEWRPDLIVSDIGMPEEDGYSFVRRIREWEKETGLRIPALALTAYARSEDRIQALSAGYQMYLAKPVDSVELATVVASLINQFR